MDWKNKPHQIFNKIKNQMFAKGVENFSFIFGCIEQFDPEHTGFLSPHAFNLFTNKIGIFLTTQEIRNIRDLYGKGEAICYRDLLEDVKYSMPEKITALISQAFDRLDTEMCEHVSLDRLSQLYRSQQHPHVLSRRRSPEEVYDIFITGMKSKSQNGLVSRSGFVDYYADINFCVPNERQKYFAELLKNTWNLQDPADYVTPQRLREIELILFEKIRQKSDGKSSEWKCAKKALSYFDLADEGSCDLEGFAKGLDKFGCNFKPHEIKTLFLKYDLDKSGRLDYQEFSKMLMSIDINGMVSQPDKLKTLGTNYWKITH